MDKKFKLENKPEYDELAAEAISKGDFEGIDAGIVPEKKVKIESKPINMREQMMNLKPGSVRFKVIEFLETLPGYKISLRQSKDNPMFYSIISGTPEGEELIGKVLNHPAIGALERREESGGEKLADLYMYEIVNEILDSIKKPQQ